MKGCGVETQSSTSSSLPSFIYIFRKSKTPFHNMNCSFNLSASMWLTSCNKIKDSPSFPPSFLAHHQTKLSNSIVPQMWLWDGEMNWKFNGCWGHKNSILQITFITSRCKYHVYTTVPLMLCSW